jgi:hypothetical protein
MKILMLALMLLVISCEDNEGKIRDANDAAQTNTSTLDEQNPTRKSSFDLRVGDCFNESIIKALEVGESGDQPERVEFVSCNDPHDFEVVDFIYVDKPSDAPYPGEFYFNNVWSTDCPLESEVFLFPSAVTWEMDHRVVTCLVE